MHKVLQHPVFLLACPPGGGFVIAKHQQELVLVFAKEQTTFALTIDFAGALVII